MAELAPQPFPVLLARILEEEQRHGSVFDLERRHFFRGREDLDLSVRFHGDVASTPVGPAAGPQSQLAQNIVLAWLAGARVIELKTVQVNDRLKIPRPCIDAANVGFNVEWSQELRLEESIAEYVAGWYLVHVLQKLNFAGAPAAQHRTLFDFSVGYDLEGIQSDPVARWLDTLQDAGKILSGLRDGLPRGLREIADVEVPVRLSSCVTLSTFHGCPAGEIERIVEHLMVRHGVHVIIKLNPTLLGYEAVDGLLHGRLGYDEVVLDSHAFEADLQWDHALAMFDRLSAVAARRGLTLGAKFTNTLVVKNHRTFFPATEQAMYLSGQPLHVISTSLADRFTRATGGRFGISFSAGIDASNLHEAVACGMAPITACTDLLRPGGYGRLPKYLKNLEAELDRVGAKTVPQYILRRAGEPLPAGTPAPASVWAAAQKNLAAYAARVASDERYHAKKNRAVPRKVGSRLALLDCLSCNKCVQVCPNDANFRVETGEVALDTWDVVVEAGGVATRRARFEAKKSSQWATFADFCNECGNCDVFCPEDGGPYRVKPRFFGSRASFDGIAPQDGVLVEDEGRRVLARIGGVLHELVRDGAGARFTDGAVELQLDAAHALVAAKVRDAPVGHVLPLWRYHALRLLVDAALGRVNPVTAPILARRRA